MMLIFDVFVWFFDFLVRAEISEGLQFVLNKSRIGCQGKLSEISQSTLCMQQNIKS